MVTKIRYRYLNPFADRRGGDLEIRGTGVRASTLWHDRYVSRMPPERIARDRDIPETAVFEALDYCQENWERICREKDLERARLRRRGFFVVRRPGHP
jgi:uncharacterized protein (DUF433 family)